MKATLQIIADEYLLNKFKHCPRVGEFSLNFSDVSFDFSSYIEENYFEYIIVLRRKLDEEERENLTEDAKNHLNMMRKNYVTRYVFAFRDRLLSLLEEKVAIAKTLYKMDDELREALKAENVNVDAINSSYKEWRAKKMFSVTKRDVINYNRHYGLISLIRSDLINLNNELEERGLPTFSFNPHYKKDFTYINGKKVAASYNSFRIYDDLALTKNDIEKGGDFYKNSEERMRSDWIDDFCKEHEGFSYNDLGDMSSNFPNLLYCIKNGVYLDKDFHTEIAEKYGIDRKVAKMAAVACCFNQTKKQAIFHIIKDADEETKELFKKSKLLSEKTGLLKNRDCYVDMFHEWLKENVANEYMKKSLDMLTSWEACHKEYANELCKADLGEFSSVVEIRVIIEAYKKGFIIYNAYDHGYCFNGEYDWKGEYKKWAEIYAVEFNKFWELDKVGYRNKKDYGRINFYKFSNKENGRKGGKMGNREGKARGGSVRGGKKLGHRNAAKDEVFEYVIKYGVHEAQKKYGWTKQAKCYWNRRLKKYNAEHSN